MNKICLKKKKVHPCEQVNEFSLDLGSGIFSAQPIILQKVKKQIICFPLTQRTQELPMVNYS